VPDDHVDNGLFLRDRVERAEKTSAAPKAPVENELRPFSPDQVLLLPPSLDDWLPADHLTRFIAESSMIIWTCGSPAPTPKVRARRRTAVQPSAVD
jgi:hypothetical protein